MSTPSVVNPKDEALLVAINDRIRQLSYLGETLNDSEGEEFQQGFEAGVKWQRSQGDSLARDLIGAVTEAIQMFEGLEGLRISGGISRLAEKRVAGWQRLIDTAEERA